MVDIYGSHFEFGGVSSRNYGLIIANVDTERLTNLSGVFNSAYVYNKKTQQRYIVDNMYNDFPITFDVNIVVDEDGKTIEPIDIHEIEKWLFNRRNYRKLYIDEVDDCFNQASEPVAGSYKRLYLNCRFVNATRLEYFGGVVGYRATLEADSGLWWQDPVTYTFNLGHTSTSQTSTITVTVDTDIDEYVYPTVTCTVGSSNTGVKIINNRDDLSRITEVADVAGNNTFVIDGETNYVRLTYPSDFVGWKFPRLLDGVNTITVQGLVSSISFEFQNRRFL